MGLFDLFQKSDWKKLNAFPVPIQLDIGNLIALDAIIKAVVANGARRLLEQCAPNSPAVYLRMCKALSEQQLTHELQLAVLSTGVGKEFSTIPWSHLPPANAVSFLGILAMCEYRNSEQLIIENELRHSGYSIDPDDARTQLLILMANQASIEDLDPVRDFDSDLFHDFWLELRKTIFANIELSITPDRSGLSTTTKERFGLLSTPRKQILLLLADSLSKKKKNAETKPEPPKSASAPFNLEQSQKDHPFKYVPYHKLVRVMQGLPPKFERYLKSLSIEEYELRRIVGATNDAPGRLIQSLIEMDSNTAAYCIVAAAVMLREPGFAGCGVWKKLTEAFETQNKGNYFSAAQAMTTGSLGESNADANADTSKIASLALNLMQEIRKSPGKFTKSNGDDMSRLSALLAGTLVFKHILNSPRFGKPFAVFLIDSINSIGPVLDEIESGELLTWDQQEKL